MTRRPDTPCKGCGKMLWTSKTSTKAERACRSCRNAGYGWPQAARPSTAKRPGRVGRPWKRLREQVLAEESDCFRCGLPVDKTLPHNTPFSASVDHIVPVADGGAPLDRANVALAHHGCNARAGNWERRGRARRTQADYAAALMRGELAAALDELIARVGLIRALQSLRT